MSAPIILLTIFLLSSANLAVMVLYRHWEIKTGRISPSFADAVSKQPFFGTLERFFLYTNRFVALYAKRTWQKAERFLRKIFRSLRTRFKKTAPAHFLRERFRLFRGRNQIVKKDATSLFLKAMLEHKGKIRAADGTFDEDIRHNNRQLPL